MLILWKLQNACVFVFVCLFVFYRLQPIAIIPALLQLLYCVVLSPGCFLGLLLHLLPIAANTTHTYKHMYRFCRALRRFIVFMSSVQFSKISRIANRQPFCQKSIWTKRMLTIILMPFFFFQSTVQQAILTHADDPHTCRGFNPPAQVLASVCLCVYVCVHS